MNKSSHSKEKFENYRWKLIISKSNKMQPLVNASKEWHVGEPNTSSAL